MKICLVLFVTGLSVVTANSLFPKCDTELIAKIKAYWKGDGVPRYMLSKEGFAEIFKSQDPKEYFGIKCFESDYKFPKTEDKTKPVEKDGVITYKGKKTYVAFYSEGIGAFYSCSDNGPQPDPTNNPDIGTIVYADNADRKELNHAKGLMMVYGFKLHTLSKCCD